MLELLRQPWHWSVAGVLIGLTVPTLLLLGNKSFGISANLRHICAACIPANIPFFKYDWRKEMWNIFFASGILIGGLLAVSLFKNPNPIQISPITQARLEAEGIHQFSGLVPTDLFNFENIFTLKGFIIIILGGFLVGFGTRYAGGCTSGHAITGLSHLQIPSLIATVCFMVGGILMTWFGLPFILSL